MKKRLDDDDVIVIMRLDGGIGLEVRCAVDGRPSFHIDTLKERGEGVMMVR